MLESIAVGLGCFFGIAFALCWWKEYTSNVEFKRRLGIYEEGEKIYIQQNRTMRQAIYDLEQGRDEETEAYQQEILSLTEIANCAGEALQSEISCLVDVIQTLQNRIDVMTPEFEYHESFCLPRLEVSSENTSPKMQEQPQP